MDIYVDVEQRPHWIENREDQKLDSEFIEKLKPQCFMWKKTRDDGTNMYYSITLIFRVKPTDKENTPAFKRKLKTFDFQYHKTWQGSIRPTAWMKTFETREEISNIMAFLHKEFPEANWCGDFFKKDRGEATRVKRNNNNLPTRLYIMAVNQLWQQYQEKELMLTVDEADDLKYQKEIIDELSNETFYGGLLGELEELMGV